MGFFSFLKKIVGDETVEEAELEEARKRHGIELTAEDRAEMDKSTPQEERFAQEYDVWEDLKHYRSNFFFGSWVTRKFYPVGEDKVKRQLEELEKKREEERRRKEERGE